MARAQSRTQYSGIIIIMIVGFHLSPANGRQKEGCRFSLYEMSAAIFFKERFVLFFLSFFSKIALFYKGDKCFVLIFP